MTFVCRNELAADTALQMSRSALLTTFNATQSQQAEKVKQARTLTAALPLYLLTRSLNTSVIKEGKQKCRNDLSGTIFALQISILNHFIVKKNKMGNELY